MPKSWQITAIRADLSPEMRRFAEEVRRLTAHLDGPSLRAAAKAVPLDPSVLSRAVTAKRVPSWDALLSLHRAAEERAQATGESCIAVADFRDVVIAARAAQEACARQSCVDLRDAYRRTLPVQRPQDGGEAGSQEEAAAAGRSAAPASPVPSPEGDRQRSAFHVPAARELADRAADLAKSDIRDGMAALALIRHSSEAMTPPETAAAAVLLRKEDPHLTESFLAMVARDSSATDVIKVASALHDYGLIKEAGAVLHIAATASGAPGGAFSATR